MSRRDIYGIVVLVCLLVRAGHSQTPIEVSLCDLVKEPSKFSNQVVSVRGRVAIGFEEFSLDGLACGERLRNVWLMYGGDEPTPTTSTVNDQERNPGSVLRVRGTPVPLQHDASLELFRGRLVAERVGGPDDLGCHELQCRLYDVTATLTGIFLAAPDDRVGGYGHLGCCHLLVIQSVSDVSARRTMVPAGGRFSCSTDAWNVSAVEAEQLSNVRECHSFADCRKAAGEQMGKVAKHWGDDIDVEHGRTGFLTGAPSWSSPDLLTTYSLEFHHQDERHERGALTGALASRRVCKPLVDPYPLATPIACRKLFSDFTTSLAGARDLAKNDDFGHES